MGKRGIQEKLYCYQTYIAFVVVYCFITYRSVLPHTDIYLDTRQLTCTHVHIIRLTLSRDFTQGKEAEAIMSCCDC